MDFRTLVTKIKHLKTHFDSKLEKKNPVFILIIYLFKFLS